MSEALQYGFPTRMSASASPLVLVVSPSINAKGMRATSVRGPLFDARLNGRLVVSRSTQPLFDGGGALLAEGIDPSTAIVMRYAGSNADSVRSTVGAAAGLTVRDDGGGKPVFAEWHSYDGPSRVPVTASMRQDELAGSGLAEQTEIDPRAVAAE